MTDAAPVSTANPVPAGSPASPDTKAAPATTGTNTVSGQETPKAAPQTSAELFEIKVNGKTQKVSRDDLIRRAQLAESATERFEQAAAKERHIQSLMAQSKDDPIATLMQMGLTKDEARLKFESWYSTEYIEPETLTKEQRELNAAKKELERYRAAEKEAQDKAKAEKDEEEVATHRELLQKQIMDTIEQHNLPKTKKVARAIAFYMRQSLAKGFEAPMELIVQKVQDDFAAEREDIPEGADYDTLVRMLGQTTVDKVISEHLKKIRNKRQTANPNSFLSEKELKAKSKGPISMREAEENLKRLMGRN